MGGCFCTIKEGFSENVTFEQSQMFERKESYSSGVKVGMNLAYSRKSKKANEANTERARARGKRAGDEFKEVDKIPIMGLTALAMSLEFFKIWKVIGVFRAE